ncbi:shwachman-Bodian-Diamond syndrome protein [Colletotrichum higginsianum]|uniref:Shwachman-Bodian-Diamond syndrome protein n=5 Tax=Colletotrichum destructivum species complex TaxID=2707350 RepID=H1W468_COLHI|nr:Shwachman-Bodian-Diamond syndrome protein [Colletotrichum higginsianum IMI 349063]TID05066.1 SDO1-like protein C21C3.19 [Colletotrichum higginsianum]TQN73865.1 SDO1-like protein [Colletotrichum shisoi]WQF78200.1 Putative ribosome maturation protein SDO1/SBDS [Colletotrichum destructivum]OBR15805.1 Shwachman-Bodian-Diamond syndrome protein [Colletotrichum higginsianum IMI 349063]CCF47281.1 shwachman-Bodian-Diamond syndrome protein [Colletotrichum higginsianum]
MVRGEAHQTKVHYKGQEDDFIVFVEDVELFKKWKTDKSVPLAHFISSYKIFVTHKQGNQGTFDAASKSTLENEFGTSVDDKVIIQILEKGEAQNAEFPERQGNKNDSQGPMVAH